MSLLYLQLVIGVGIIQTHSGYLSRYMVHECMLVISFVQVMLGHHSLLGRAWVCVEITLFIGITSVT